MTKHAVALSALALVACSTPVPPPDATSPAGAFTFSLDAPGVDAHGQDAV